MNVELKKLWIHGITTVMVVGMICTTVVIVYLASIHAERARDVLQLETEKERPLKVWEKEAK